MDKYTVTLNIGENCSAYFGAVAMLVKTQTRETVKWALFKTLEFLNKSKGMAFDFDSVKVLYIDRKSKSQNPETENAFVVQFQIWYKDISLNAQYDMYCAIGMMAATLFQEAIAFQISATFGEREIVVYEALAGLHKHLWGGGAFDPTQFVTLRQAENGEF